MKREIVRFEFTHV